MPATPPKDMPRITPYLYYEDVAGALAWLARSFGLKERMRMPGPDGSIMHAEMEFAEGVIIMGRPDVSYRNPKHLGQITQSLYVYVDGVDEHCARARSAGVTIVSEPETMFWGDRTYVAQDLEGHRWTFAEHVTDVAPEDMKPPA